MDRYSSIPSTLNLLQRCNLGDNFVFPAVLKAATGLQDLNLGKQIHGSVVKLGYDTISSTVGNSLIHLLGQCGGSVNDVCKVFDRITQGDQVSWNSLIYALCKFEKWELALEAFRLMDSRLVRLRCCEKGFQQHCCLSYIQVIPAFEEAITGMAVGGIRRIIVPPELGYPDNDYNKKGPRPTTFSGQRALDFVLRNQGLIDKTLLFDIELLKIVPK
ncbi:peptidyl-prolyl cis-trans isomerase fkbp19, chloroplastic [Nicotiana attenuata]|uniref:peptidylprolyl isomerase n=1 Tax=Nicotiana attenuata TaxID=49451 RepID=A0A1J6HZY2_NICAT|nr:peptidyl-prolyl cis-trans isomerase fkbp19, chloroplastic [Nicotiana attenuata]